MLNETDWIMVDGNFENDTRVGGGREGDGRKPGRRGSREVESRFAPVAFAFIWQLASLWLITHLKGIY